jgi:hypothetical protein
MSRQVFVTGMLRSGTTLTQVLLTNHPQAWVAYQPFHQLYVDVKQRYLDARGLDLSPPLEDGAPDSPDPQGFVDWLARHRFSDMDARALADRATSGKGGSMAAIADCLRATPGTFADLRQSLHASMAQCLDLQPRDVMGSKEILCEEFLLALADAGVHCIIVIRDPRAVIASANHGRYHDSVGDRYPLLMLIRLWRKSAGYWLRLRAHPRIRAIRYEDLIGSTDAVLAELAQWLGVAPFPPDMANAPLQDHQGLPWRGNSSFGDTNGVDQGSLGQWQGRLDRAEVRFIEACTFEERNLLGYDADGEPGLADIAGFVENETGVRAAYLKRHAITPDAVAAESRRLESALAVLAEAR